MDWFAVCDLSFRCQIRRKLNLKYIFYFLNYFNLQQGYYLSQI